MANKPPCSLDASLSTCDVPTDPKQQSKEEKMALANNRLQRWLNDDDPAAAVLRAQCQPSQRGAKMQQTPSAK
ncbi:Uncharacterized protein TPAR_06717 [Tolypocladium paradoxum]|uniref:Uncharacterized protein n=1 Tax=Tolypocladium paradoxum TaxID=94208 RepID=A0A2S4KSE2_9HYPO|nr:Uncharacterized protein TPAR_06717 [Tolypocladium paradoxum]